MNCKVKREIETYIIDFEVVNNRKPYMYEIMEDLSVSFKMMRNYFNETDVNYPNELQISKEEHEIIKAYDKNQSYSAIAKALGYSEATTFGRLKRLFDLKIIKEKETVKHAPHKKAKKHCNGFENNQDVIYVKVKEGLLKDCGGYTFIGNLNNNLVSCQIYKDRVRTSELIKRVNLKIMTPNKMMEVEDEKSRFRDSISEAD